MKHFATLSVMPVVLRLAFSAILMLLPALSQAAPLTDAHDPAYLGFFPALRPSGTLPVTLVPHPSAVGRVVPISFGVPFPPGYVIDPEMIALFDSSGSELPIHVEVLAQWLPPVPGAPSIRAVLIQYLDLMATRLPRTYTLCWGKPRTQSRSTGWPADRGWFPVSDGSYPAVRVKDPVAWALLPASWLGQALIKGRLSPAGRYKNFSWLETGHWAFFRQAINRPILDGPQKNAQENNKDIFKIRYDRLYEPWLFDRTTTIFLQYLTTGKLEPLAYAIRDIQFYASNVQENGNFALLKPGRPPSVIYGNQEALTLGWFFTGLPRLKIASARVVKLLDAWNPEYSPSRSFWTERHMAYHLMIATAAYEMTGNPALLERARHAFEIAYSMQVNPPPSAPRDGCLIHTGKQHSGPIKGWICSPWMSTLFIDSAMRYYLVSADSRVAICVRMLADYLVDNGTYQLTTKNAKRRYTFPYYLASSIEKSEKQPSIDWQHCLDVSKILALAIYFAKKEGKPYQAYYNLFNELLISSQEMIPKKSEHRAVGYILFPPRKFSWWFRTTADLPWLVNQ